MKKYITNKILNHGLGSRILKLINVIGYVSYLNKHGGNYEFVYTPFSYEGFGEDFDVNQLYMYYHKPIFDQRLEYIELCKRWDDMLKYNGKTIYDLENFDNLILLIHPQLGDPTFGASITENEEFERFNETRLIKNKIKQDFNITNTQKHDYINISVHIRRGDVNPYYTDRWIDDFYYLEIINKLKEKYNGQNYKITIYTQRNNFNPVPYQGCEISYDDQTLDNEIWKKLIFSDVLVLGRSSYSYSAGILCDGLVIYPRDKFFHPKLNDWKLLEEL
jgi:hypothetical protein